MRQSQLFTKTRKESPKDETSKNADLLIRAGFIHKEMAGVYSFLPLGLRVLKNIEKIIREEMNAIGGVEMEMTTLQDKTSWEKSGRWDDAVVDNWFKTKLKNDTELGLAFTHEEPLTSIMKNHVGSYRDLPMYPYQFQTKFRNEERAKSGIIRGREFLMKDLYSFSKNEKEHESFYKKAIQAYTNIFKRLGIGDMTYITQASGGSFSKFSHEFQTVCDAGEDVIYVDEKNKGAVNKELWNDKDAQDVLKMTNADTSSVKETKAVEVGNIFTLGTRFAEALGLTYINEEGKPEFPFMGSYGIGVSRLMGVIAEVLSDEKGLVWPVSVAPFKVHLIQVGLSENVKKEAQDFYDELMKIGVEVLFDDRDLRPGEKFADAELIGIPYRVVVSDKTLEKDGFEIKERGKEDIEIVSKEKLKHWLGKE